MTERLNTPPLLQVALDLARQGRSIIPVRRDKTPLLEWKHYQQQRATEEQIEKWFGSEPAWGLAIVTGAISGCGVLDIDGEEGFAALRTRGFDIPPTLQVRTPRGGAHFYFQAPELPTKNFTGGTKACPLPKVDFRGDRGYVVAPPTPGYEYVEHLPLAPLPDWLKVLVIPGWSLVDEAMQNASEGNRNVTGFALACKLRDSGLTEECAKPLMQAFTDAVQGKGAPPYTKDEALASLDSAFSKPARPPRPDGERSARLGQASRVLTLCEGLELFHAPDQTAYAVLPFSSHRETWPIRSKTFKQFLARQSFERTGKVPAATALGDAMTVLEGQALFAGPEREVSLRVANRQGSIVLDLCNARWEVIVTDATGWRIENTSPVNFRRTRGLLPFPTPIPGGSLDGLREFLNLSDDDQWRLLVAWLLNAMRPHGPFPILCVHGEQGSGKSTAVRLIRALTDPSVAPVRSEPREVRDLMIAATNSYLQAFDNLSGLPPWLSDALCRLSTGGGLSTRELYSNVEEIILDAVRPVILNGIDAIVTRSDLLDRALLLTLPTIDERQRRSEADLLHRFEEARPRLFGALLTALSRSLKYMPEVHLDRLPRMADFALFGIAVERALAWPAGSFLEAYEENRNAGHLIALDGSPIVAPLENLLETREAWRGTATELLQALDAIASYDTKRRHGWPQSERQLGARLSRLAPNLRAVGITVDKERLGHEGKRIIHLTKGAKLSSALSACQHTQEIQEFGADNSADNQEGGVVSKTLQPRAGAANAANADNTNPLSSNGQKTSPSLAALSKKWRPVKPLYENNDVNNGVKSTNNTRKGR